MALSNLQARVLTGIFGGGAFVTLIFLHPAGLWFLCFAMSLLCMVEFLALMTIGLKHISAMITLFAITALWALVAVTWVFKWWQPITSLAIMCIGLLSFVPAMSILNLFRKKQAQPFVQLAHLLLGIFYILPGMLSFFFSGFVDSATDYNPFIPFGLVMMFWGSDTAAYFAGRALGKHKLMPRVSPNKSWEGAIGGFLMPVALSVAYIWLLPNTAFPWVIAGLLVGILSPIGDLVESLLKRNVGAKDAGSILPGHGGLLDRFDGLLVALPILLSIWLAFKVIG